MKYNTIKKRLKLYREALIDYETRAKHTTSGFCHYFYHTYDIYLYNGQFEQLLPELYATKPSSYYKRWEGGEYSWFSNGNVVPRIRCLKRAIDICIQKLKQNE